MCGLVGIFRICDAQPVERALLARMNDTQLHRGPDECGLHVEPGVGLGHRRLSIIDLKSGQQPLANEDGSVLVTYNGEIYNFGELMAELQGLGHVFRSRCDTEVIVHAWEQWGESCVQRMRGMFAFALWDRNRQTLFLARDRLGVKPLYYAELADGSLIFGSELKALLAHPGFSRHIDPQAIEEYFAYGYVPDPRTVFTSARKLPPGHTLSVRRGTLVGQPRAYWEVPFSPVGPLSFEAAQEELLGRLREAVALRLVADVPLGAFLSGGIDSSAVVAMMAEPGGDPINTCSIAFSDPRFDESRYAQAVAERYGTRHRVERVDTQDFGLVEQLAAIYDEPFADSSAIPTYRVCQLARKGVTVALSGDGGDENFAGYRRYRWHMVEERWRSALPLGLRRSLFGLLGAVYPKADWAPRVVRAKTTFQALARDSVEAYFHTVSILRDDMRDELFSPRLKRDLQGYNAVEVMRHHAARSPTDDPLGLIQYLDFKTYLPGDILTKVDRASMAHALEVREPLLDHPLVEWLSGLPPQFKLRDGEGKYLLKKTLEPHLPAHVIYRPKMGFAVPLATWFRGPLRHRVRDALLGGVLSASGYFNQQYLLHLVEEHQSGMRDYSAPLWTLLMFESFLRNVSGEKRGRVRERAVA